MWLLTLVPDGPKMSITTTAETIESENSNLPTWVVMWPLVFTFLVLAAATVYFRGMILPLFYIFYGIGYCILFFIGTRFFYNRWADLPDPVFSRRLFFVSMFFRLFTVVFLYFVYIHQTGIPFEPYAADSYTYDNLGKQIALGIMNSTFNASQFFHYDAIDDTGQPMLIGLLYYIFGSHVIVFRLFNVIIGSLTVLIYFKLAGMVFSRYVARLSSVMFMLYPSVLYYTGLHLKETTMIFMIILTIYAGIKINKSIGLNLSSVLLFLAGLIPIFFFRITLGVLLFASFILYSVFFQLAGKGRNIIKLLISIAVCAPTLFIAYNTPIHERLQTLYERSTDQFESSMNYRAARQGGNALAEHASLPLFILLGLSGPNPGLVDIPMQENLSLENPGKFAMNMLAFFGFLGFLFVFRNRSPEHLFIIAVLFGWIYAFSVGGFGMSGRFHLLTQPFLFLYISQGIFSVTERQKRCYVPYLVLISTIILVWNFLKLYGRGIA